MASDKMHQKEESAQKTTQHPPKQKQKHITNKVCKQMKQMRIPLTEIHVQIKSINLLQYLYVVL